MLMRELLPVANPAFRTTTVLESEVRRYPGMVSLFAPGSFSKRPPLDTALPSIVCAGAKGLWAAGSMAPRGVARGRPMCVAWKPPIP